MKLHVVPRDLLPCKSRALPDPDKSRKTDGTATARRPSTQTQVPYLSLIRLKNCSREPDPLNSILTASIKDKCRVQSRTLLKPLPEPQRCLPLGKTRGTTDLRATFACHKGVFHPQNRRCNHICVKALPQPPTQRNTEEVLGASFSV